jgi:GMP synthase (glutamine-hydrolysing)
MAAPKVLAIYHVAHERLGGLDKPLRAAKITLVPFNAASPKARWPKHATDYAGYIVMGGPMGVYEQAKHPFLAREITLLSQAVRADRPVLGICLGAQLLAAALGARVLRNPTKEIGWHPVMREPGADSDRMCDAFGQTETVFQWHGDTYELPRGAVRLFSSPLCPEQAFRFGERAHGFQFHVEVTPVMVRAWLVKNKKELADLKGQIDSSAIRAQIRQHSARLQELCAHVSSTFARQVNGSLPSSARRPAYAGRG